MDVLAIAVFTNGLFFTMGSYMLTWNVLHMSRVMDVVDKMSGQFGKVLGILEDQTGVVGDLTKHILVKDKPPKKR
jgi:hypothetical protein